MKLFENSIVRGAIAGTIATVPMTLVMTRLFRALPSEQKTQPLPPGQITHEMENRVGLDVDQPTHETLTIASHFGYGAACGALYGLAASRIQARPSAKGVLFGLGVWAASYLGWLPAMGILPSATRQPRERNGLMIAAHVIWGATLGSLVNRSTREIVREAVVGFKGQGREARWLQSAIG